MCCLYAFIGCSHRVELVCIHMSFSHQLFPSNESVLCFHNHWHLQSLLYFPTFCKPTDHTLQCIKNCNPPSSPPLQNLWFNVSLFPSSEYSSLQSTDFESPSLDIFATKNFGTNYGTPATHSRLALVPTFASPSESEFLKASLTKTLSIFDVTSGLRADHKIPSLLGHPEFDLTSTDCWLCLCSTTGHRLIYIKGNIRRALSGTDPDRP